MDGDFAVAHVVNRDDLHHAAGAVGAVGSDVQHANDLIDVRSMGPAVTALSLAWWMSASAIPWRRALARICLAIVHHRDAGRLLTLAKASPHSRQRVLSDAARHSHRSSGSGCQDARWAGIDITVSSGALGRWDWRRDLGVVGAGVATSPLTSREIAGLRPRTHRGAPKPTSTPPDASSATPPERPPAPPSPPHRRTRPYPRRLTATEASVMASPPRSDQYPRTAGPRRVRFRATVASGSRAAPAERPTDRGGAGYDERARRINEVRPDDATNGEARPVYRETGRGRPQRRTGPTRSSPLRRAPRRDQAARHHGTRAAAPRSPVPGHWPSSRQVDEPLAAAR